MKRLAFIVFAAMAFCNAFGQYMPNEKGVVYTYEAKNLEDDKTNTYTATVVDVTTSDKGVVTANIIEKINTEDSFFGEIEEPSTYIYNPADKKTTYVIVTPESFKEMMTKQIRQMISESGQFVSESDIEEITSRIKPKGEVSVVLPDEAAPGSSMPNHTLRASMGEGMTVGMKITKGTYQGYEEVATPAGTFNCLKVTYTFSIIGESADQKVTAWYAPGVGLVKQVDADRKGNEKGVTELQKIEK